MKAQLLPRGLAGRQLRKAWLREHAFLWTNKSVSYRRRDGSKNPDFLRVFFAMQDAGLYSRKTVAIDAHIDELVEEIRREGR